MQFMDLGAYSLVERSSEATETGPRKNHPREYGGGGGSVLLWHVI